jgi:hypothetical protein
VPAQTGSPFILDPTNVTFDLKMCSIYEPSYLPPTTWNSTLRAIRQQGREKMDIQGSVNL